MIYLIFVLCSLSVYCQEPLVKFYLNDGSTKQYDIADIANMSLIHSNLSYSMTIFQKGNKKTDIDIRVIDLVMFERTTDNSGFYIKVVQSDESNTFDLSDIDSIIFVFNTCEEIQIGTQIWMCRNLDVDHYRNGDSIPQITDPTQWVGLTTGAWCYYNNDPAMGKIYGKLYNWYAVNDTRGLAPESWHVPSDSEWTILTDYLGGKDVAGGKLKEAGTYHWQSSNTGANNVSGFTALPGGYREIEGNYSIIGIYGYWWSSTEESAKQAYDRHLYNICEDIDKYHFSKVIGFSVRVVRD